MAEAAVAERRRRIARPNGWRSPWKRIMWRSPLRKKKGESQEIILRSADEIARMREAGRIAGEVLATLATCVQAGITTFELDQIAEQEIRRRGALPSFKGLYGFKGSICASVNDQIVHGVPSKTRRLREGDLMKIDLGASIGRYHSDAAITVPVGSISGAAARLVAVTRESLEAGIAAAQPGGRVKDISEAVERTIRAAGKYGIVRDFVGHGVGVGDDREEVFHAAPQVPNWVDPEKPVMKRLDPGLVIAIEPMVNLGTLETRKLRDDDWTVYTADGRLSAHFEHTIAITRDGPVILTLP